MYICVQFSHSHFVDLFVPGHPGSRERTVDDGSGQGWQVSNMKLTPMGVTPVIIYLWWLWWDVPANQPSSELGVILMDQPPYHRGRGCPNEFVLEAMVTTGNPSCGHLSQPCSCSHRPPFPRRDGLEKPAGCWSMLESLKRTRDKLVFVRDISGI